MDRVLSGEESKDEEEKLDPIAQGEIEDQRRKFAEMLRPDRGIWNFFDDNEETKLAHVLRANADPNASYIDGRVADLLVVIEGMGTHLRMHNNESWDHLNSMVLAIFKKSEDAIVIKEQAYEKSQNEEEKKR